MAVVKCKLYHEAKGKGDPGASRDSHSKKSRCPGWATDAELRKRLIEEAVPDPDGAQDSLGRPKVVWNAVGGKVFIGVSTNEAELAYNCYPNTPTTKLHSDLSKRAERTIEQFMISGREA